VLTVYKKEKKSFFLLKRKTSTLWNLIPFLYFSFAVCHVKQYENNVRLQGLHFTRYCFDRFKSLIFVWKDDNKSNSRRFLFRIKNKKDNNWLARQSHIALYCQSIQDYWMQKNNKDLTNYFLFYVVILWRKHWLTGIFHWDAFITYQETTLYEVSLFCQ
jgi:hypothetical protein